MGHLSGNQAGNAPQMEKPRNKRILVLMALIGTVGGLSTGILISVRFGLGIIVGTAIAFANYFWMQRSLKKAFDFTATEIRPRFAGSGYFVRYLAIGAFVAVIYASGILPIAAVLIGAAGFAFALVAEGLIRLAGAVYSPKTRNL